MRYLKRCALAVASSNAPLEAYSKWVVVYSEPDVTRITTYFQLESLLLNAHLHRLFSDT